jgi:tetratricopeptide (TPR) repeat protein
VAEQLKNITLKQYPMNRITLLIFMLLASSRVYSQTESFDFYFQQGILEKQNGRKLESLKKFEQAEKIDATNRELISELANTYHDLRKYQQARNYYKKLWEMGDESAATLRQLMILSFNLKQYEDAVSWAAKLKKADPTEKVSYYIGKSHYETDNYGEAIRHLNMAIKEEPENAEIPYMIARSFADMMNYKQAIPFFQKAIELDPSKNYWIYELGLICYAMHDDKNALKYIIEAGEKGYKKDNDYLENLGIAYLNVGNLDEGVNILNEILKRKPSDLNVLNMIAEAYYYKSKYKEAIEYWDQILYYDKANAPALYMIGMSYQKKGEKEKGIALCDKAIEMDPNLAAYKQKRMDMGL